MTEYPQYRLPFESLTTIDERVDYIHLQVNDVQVAMSKLLEKEGLPPMGIITREVVFRETVRPLEGIRAIKGAPFNGRITQILRHFPDGCDSLVDVAVGHGDTWVLPNETNMFVALNDATPVVSVDEPVYASENLWIIIANGDSVNLHTISITFIIEGAE